MEEYHYGPEGKEVLPADFVYGSYGYKIPSAKATQADAGDFHYGPEGEEILPATYERPVRFSPGDSNLYTYVHYKPALETRDPSTAHKPPDDQWILRLLGNRRPLAFEAGDSNLYRYAGNRPTNATDPSGLVEIPGPGYRVAPRTPQEEAAEEANRQRLRQELQGLPLSDHFRVRVTFRPGGLGGDFSLRNVGAFAR
jgi:hypothetical protein